MRTLVIMGHPRIDSLCAAIASSYYKGAKDAGSHVMLLLITDLRFDLNVNHSSPHLQPDEPDLTHARDLVKWADHLVFVFPTWWGTMPALLKGFIDRVFVSHFAFLEIKGGTGYEPLLKGKSAQLITTMDTPKFVYRYIYRAPGIHAMAQATLGFCGVIMKRSIIFSAVRYSDAQLRNQWLDEAYEAGYALKNGIFSKSKLQGLKVLKWIKAIRLQFYPMTFIAYSVGALLAQLAGTSFNSVNFWLGYAWIFFAEVLTVFTNEYFDLQSDSKNELFGPFNGGSRVLANGEISRREMKTAIFVVLATTLIFISVLLQQPAGGTMHSVIASLSLLILATGYTVPPLRLSYRGMGEITVGITHSFAVILCGFLYQGGIASDPTPWWIGLPLFLSVLPSIILAGIPDAKADRNAGKKTLAVRLGAINAARLAIVFIIAATINVLLYTYFHFFEGIYQNILFGVIPHAAWLVFKLHQYIRSRPGEKRIDGLIIIALTFLMWFAVIPLLNLL